MTRTNKVLLVALLIVATTNPWSVGYIGTIVDQLVVWFTLYANYVFVAGLILLCTVNIWLMYTTRQKVNIPQKGKKTSKAGKYID